MAIKVVKASDVSYVSAGDVIPRLKGGFYGEVTSGEDNPLMAGCMFKVVGPKKFEWTYEYDEIYIMTDGPMKATVAGKTTVLNIGDMCSVRKGDTVILEVENCANMFCVTHPPFTDPELLKAIKKRYPD